MSEMKVPSKDSESNSTNTSNGVYVASDVDFLPYFKGLTEVQRNQYIALEADLILGNPEIMALLGDNFFSRDEFIGFMKQISVAMLKLKNY